MLATSSHTTDAAHRSALLVCLVALALIIPTLSAWGYTGDLVLKVGVLSPSTGGSSIAGGSHRESIELAYHRLGSVLRSGDQLVRIKLVSIDYETREACAVTRAKALVADDSVVALLGPINSGAVRHVLETLRGLEEGTTAPPLLSALATAPGLGKENDAFFRLTFDDTTRMKQYAGVIGPKTESFGRDELYFAAQETDYGQGLLDGIKQKLDGKEARWTVAAMPSPDGSGSGAGPDCSDATTSDDGETEGEEARSTAQASVAPEPRMTKGSKDELKQAKAVVLLGSTSGSLHLAEELTTGGRGPDIYLVGSNHTVFTRAPQDAHTIGDPALDPYRAQSDRERIEWTRVLREFQDRQRMSIDDFMPTAYEAYSVLRQALEILLREQLCNLDPAGGLTKADTQCLRRELTRILRHGRFDSLDAWRTIAFDDQGELDTPPLAPVYRIERSATRVRDNPEHGWVEIDVAEKSGALLGPTRIVLRPYGPMRGRDTRLYLIKEPKPGLFGFGSSDEPDVEDVKVSLDSDEVVQEHLFLMPGQYRVVLSRDSNPASARFSVVWPTEYPVAWVTALIAVGLVAYRDRSRAAKAGKAVEETVGARQIALRAAGGVFTASLLLFLLAYGLRWFPTELSGLATLSVPESVLAGILGGVGGPGLLGGLLQGTFDRWTGTGGQGGGGASARASGDDAGA